MGCPVYQDNPFFCALCQVPRWRTGYHNHNTQILKQMRLREALGLVTAICAGCASKRSDRYWIDIFRHVDRARWYGVFTFM